MSNNDTTTHAIIKVTVFDKEYSSILMDIENDEDNHKLVQIISEQGTSHLSMFKMPVSESSFVIFSREQLNSAVFEVTIVDKPNPKKRITLRKTKSVEDTTVKD